MWLLLPAAHADDLTLGAALSKALADNPEIRVARIDVERAELGVVGSAGVYDPTLGVSVDRTGARYVSNDADEGVGTLTATTTGWSTTLSQALPSGGGATIGWTETHTESNSPATVQSTYFDDELWVSLSQPLLSGLGATARDVQQDRRALRLEELAYRSAVEALVLDVSAAYWALVAGLESERLAQGSVAIAEQEHADTLERLAAGFVGSGDVLQVERALGAARQGAIVAAHARVTAEVALRRLLGTETALVPTDRPTVPSTDHAAERARDLALAGNSRWLAAQVVREQIEADVRAARNGALPDLEVTGALGYLGAGTSRTVAREQLSDRDLGSWAVGADLEVPLPGRSLYAARKRARLAGEQAEIALDAARTDLLIAVDEAVRAVERDRARVALAETTRTAAAAALDADRELLKEGRGSTRNVLLSLEELDAAQIDHLQAQIDLQASVLELALAEGVLLEVMGVPDPLTSGAPTSAEDAPPAAPE